MSKLTTSERVKKIIADQLDVIAKEINDEHTLQELGADSLDVIEIVQSLEEEFEIVIEDEDVEKLVSVSEAILLVVKATGV